MIGIDIIDIERVDESEAFIDKIANESEKEYIKKSPCAGLQKQRIGALFCLKEAVMKALEMGKDSGVTFKDIELSHEKSGKPIVILHRKAKEKLDKNFAGKKVEVSLSHTPVIATAIAIIT